MHLSCRGPVGGLLTILAAALLVFGGLGWVTHHALQLEQARLTESAEQPRAERIRRALWRLDSRVATALAREDSRPYRHYEAVYYQYTALTPGLTLWQSGSVRLPSPLLSADLPDWILLHFQAESDGHWHSPEVVAPDLARHLSSKPIDIALTNVTPERAKLLSTFSRVHQFDQLLKRLEQSGEGISEIEPPAPVPTRRNAPADAPAPQSATLALPERAGPGTLLMQERQRNAKMPNVQLQTHPDAEYGARSTVQKKAAEESRFALDFNRNFDIDVLARGVFNEPREVRTGPMVPLWLPETGGPDRLICARQILLGRRPLVQGVILDWAKLEPLLREEVRDLFPDAKLVPLPDGAISRPEEAMSALPVQLDPGPAPPPPSPGWSPLRFGLGLAWLAATVALVALTLGGWSLIDLSERRFRFVSAVTHELRTPLTSLRLYLDLLTSGLVREETQREEYLRTLHGETERLHRLVGNVLDYARLERGRPSLTVQPFPVGAELDQLAATWGERCSTAGKELVVECEVPYGLVVNSDPELVRQVVGNFLDNACKYSRGADDARVWLRAVPAGPGRVAFEVEDRGPGVNPNERRAIFRPFRRGKSIDETAGGVGLGLALAQRWADLLGGRVNVPPAGPDGGACFRLELPAVG